MIRTIILIITFGSGTIISEIASQISGMESEMGFLFNEAGNELDEYSLAPANSEPGGPARTRTKRVVCGEAVNEFDYPFIVNLYSHDDKPMCAGTFLTKRLVLTAAHCVSDKLAYAQLKTSEEQESPARYQIEKAIPHPGYQFPKKFNAENSMNDIAVLRLRENVPNAQTVELIPPTHPEGFTSATLLGWGNTEYGCNSEQLRSVRLDIIPPDISQRYYHITSNRICTDGRRGNMGYGDSGGPLMADGYQIGIASVRMGRLCTSGLPAAFTRVSTYRDWIDGHIRSSQPGPSYERDCPHYSDQGRRIKRLCMEDIRNNGCNSREASS